MTRNTCIAGLLFSWSIGIVCLTVAHWTFKSAQRFQTHSGSFTHNGQGQRVFFTSTVNQELVKLAVNVCISLCTDCLGYIHSVSTRWALWREGLLDFNSNPRFLVSTRACSSSRWSTNIVSAFLLMLCYASSGQLFLSATTAEQEGFVLNGVAISTLGVGILGQALISTLCFWNCRELIPTWSSNPLNAVLVCLHQGLRRMEGRCMLSVHQAEPTAFPARPLAHQASARRALPSITHIIRFLWAYFISVIIWAIVIRSNPSVRQQKFRRLPIYGTAVPILQLNLCALLITVSLQLFLTLSLHFAEFLVNLSRDEQIWRLATKKKGAKFSYGPLGSFKAAIGSWQNIILFILKAVAYWLFGLALSSDGRLVYMDWEGILVLLVAVAVTAVFASLLAWNNPSGPQPAAFGHVQTLANLIDEWHDEKEGIWWGEKGVVSYLTQGQKAIRHAGTSNKGLEKVSLASLYE